MPVVVRFPEFRCTALHSHILRQADEIHADRPQFVEKHDQVPQVPPESIKAPAEEDVDLAAASVEQEAVERWAALLGAADPLVDVFDDRPATISGVSPQFGQLVLGFLIDGAHPRLIAAFTCSLPESGLLSFFRSYMKYAIVSKFVSS